MIELKDAGEGVRILTFNAGENRFHPDFLASFEDALSRLASDDDVRALVTTGSGKFYSNGLDLDWLTANGDQSEAYLKRVNALYAQLLELPLPTIVAVNGHAFAGGGMLALAHDFAVMRSDRGWFCLPEVDLGMPFTPGMSALIQARLSKATAHEAMITGRRYTGEEALAAGIVQKLAPEAEVLAEATAWASQLAAKNNGRAVGVIRRGMYPGTIAALRGPLS